MRYKEKYTHSNFTMLDCCMIIEAELSPNLLQNLEILSIEEQAMILFKQLRTLANMVHNDLRNYQSDQDSVDKNFQPNEYLA